MDWPENLIINAYTGENRVVSGTPANNARDWILDQRAPRKPTFLAPPPKADPKNWRDPRVGWGLVLPFNPNLSTIQLSQAEDAPEPIRALLKDRGEGGKLAPVLRYKAGANRVGFLHRDGVDVPVSMVGSGTEVGTLPRYLLIYASPDQIPWEVQYNLNAICAVGRLWLMGTALENYVRSLIADWKDAPANQKSAVIWTVDHGVEDITHLMRLSIALKVHAKLKADADLTLNTVLLESDNATASALVQTLTEQRPGLVVTTSHGQTGPLYNIEQMKAHLGLLVDQNRSLVQPSALLDKWEPGGAIWYAHACCSAGSDAQTRFDGLVQNGSLVDQVLKGVAQVGARIAPLPMTLLGASEPLRAFIGHVEPTFDWTLRAQTGQFTTTQIEDALYDHLYQPEPVGLAFRDFFLRVGGIYTEMDMFQRAINEGGALHRLLLARDIQSMVILGDPTAMLPKL